jgi:hypothetical protein
MTFLEQTGLTGRLFNGNRWGGYVLFRTHERFPIFVDGRWITLGEQVVRDAHAISLRRGDFLETLEDYRIEIVLVDRGWMTDELRDDPGWRTAFENFNSGIYLRNGPSFDSNLERCGAYYTARGIPFDAETGFRERVAFESNANWAAQMHVQKLQLHRFGVFGAMEIGAAPRWVAGWSE